MENASASGGKPGIDEVLGFAIADRDCRGRVVRLGPVLETILSAHQYPELIKALLAEALVLTTLMGSLLKGEGDQLTLQAQAEGGIIRLLVCDYREGELRGYAQLDEERLETVGETPSLHSLFSGGYLAVTFDLTSIGQRYQGIVPLEGSSLSEAVETYFARSEQVPTLIRTAIRMEEGDRVAGGMLIQHLADGEEGRERLHVRQDHPEWNDVSLIARTVRPDELTDKSLRLEALIWRLYNEEREVRVGGVANLTRGCRCSERHFEDVLARFPSEDRRDMRDEKGVILVDCAFCSRQFAIQD